MLTRKLGRWRRSATRLPITRPGPRRSSRMRTWSSGWTRKSGQSSAMLIRWREQAESDLIEIFDYLLERNPSAARRIRNAILGQIALLASQPGLGRAGRVTGTRELVIAHTPYVVGYTV